MTPCTIGQGHPIKGGYLRRSHKDRTVFSHRLAYCQAHGLDLADIKGKVVMHTCDNPPCCNPDHLVLGTQRENLEDMTRKGRRVVVGAHPASRRLTQEQVDYIRTTCVKGSRTYGASALAREFKMHPSAILDIVHGVTYKE